MEFINNSQFFLNKINEFKKKIPIYKNNFNQKGIIICAGDLLFPSAIICIENIIKLNPLINIEWYYCDNELFDFQKKYITNKYSNINLINCLNKIPNWFPETITIKQIKGYMIKSFALMVTSFSEVLLLDADNISLINIEELFNNPDYLNYGNIFWPDIKYSSEESIKKVLPFGNKVYESFNILEPDQLTDSGQILININKCWDAICVSYYLNYNMDPYYRLFSGDKDLYYIAFKLTSTIYNQTKFNIIPCTNEGNEYSYINSIIQRNPSNGSYAFIHRIFSKINLNNYSKILYVYDEDNLIINNESKVYIVMKEKDIIKHSRIDNLIKKTDIFNALKINEVKEFYKKNVSEIITTYNNIIQSNISYTNNKFIITNLNEINNILSLYGTYSQYNIFHLNCYCVYYMQLQKLEDSFSMIHKIFEHKMNNQETLLILIFMFRINCCAQKFNDIIKFLNDHDLFIFLFQLFNSNNISIEAIEKILEPKNNLFYKKFIKIFNFNNLKLLKDDIDNLLSKPNIIPKYNIPIYFNRFYMLSFKDNNNLSFRKKISKLNKLLFPCLNYVGSNVEENKKLFNQKKIKKVGFISTNFRLHSVGRDRIGVMRNMNRDLFDIVIIHFEEYNNDYYFNMIKTSGFKNIILKGDFNSWVKIIENENLDILVYADIGMQDETYLLAHTRLAPIQLTTYGHSESTGIDTIDYYLTSELYELPEYQNHYSEKVILQKSLGTFYYDSIYDLILNSKDSKDPLPLETNKIYLTNLQYLHKSSETDILLYEKILNKISNVYIIFVNGTNDVTYETNIKERLKKFIDRIIILPKLVTSNFYELIKTSYLILDTYPHGGCNSSLESFYYNKIVITYPSKYLRGRFTQGFYKKMGIDGCVVNSIDEYVEKIIFFVNNQKEKNKIEKLININKHKLYNDLESVYEWNNILYNLKI